MCGVIGAIFKDIKDSDLETIERVLLESEIRGKHASGLAWFDGVEIRIYKQPIPISELLKTFYLNDFVVGGNLSLIAHTRYSTSDIHFHQPLGDSSGALVHNGVISQEDPENWETKYGFKCSTKNDSELLLHSIKNNKNFLEVFHNPSISALYMNKNGDIKNFRNSLRPQWEAVFENGKIIASTKNILLRAGIDPERISKVQSCDSITERQIRYSEILRKESEDFENEW